MGEVGNVFRGSGERISSGADISMREGKEPSEADNADEPIHPDTRRGRFIAPSADLSASVDIALSGLLSKCALSMREGKK